MIETGKRELKKKEKKKCMKARPIGINPNLEIPSD